MSLPWFYHIRFQYLSCWETLSFAGFDEISAHIGVVHVLRSWEWPPANNQQEVELIILSAYKGLIPANTMWVWKWILPQSSLRLSGENQTLADILTAALQTPDSQKPCPDSWFTELWHGKCVLLKVTKFVVSCYAAIDNNYKESTNKNNP